jgi:hypothetical protein
LNEATERIIREEVFGNSGEAEERTGSPADASAVLPSYVQD